MKQEDQQYAFGKSLHNLCNRYMDEFDLTFSSVLGIIELEKLRIFHAEMKMLDQMEDEAGDGFIKD